MSDLPPPPAGFILDKPTPAPAALAPTRAAAPPPPPPGFKLDQPAMTAAAPPPPAGFALDKPSDKPEFGAGATKAMETFMGAAQAGIERKAFEQTHPELQLGDMWWKDYTDRVKQAKEQLAAAQKIEEDPNSLLPPGMQRPLAQLGAGLNYAFSPLTGTIDTFVGRPIAGTANLLRRATGREPHDPEESKRQVGDVVSMAAPFLMPKLPRGPARTPPVTPPTNPVKDGLKAVEQIFSPTTVSPEAGATERVIRRATGESSIEAERAAHELAIHNKLVGNMPVPAQRALIGEIETGKIAQIPDASLRSAAQSIRDVYDRYRTRIQQVLPPNAQPSFIQDYYVHMWKEKPQQVTDSLNAFFSRQGSGRNLKKRTIPTLADGIAAGLTPRVENPIEATMAYAQNMGRFLATHDIQNELKGMDYAKWYMPGQQPKGWVPLEGIMTERQAITGKVGTRKLYAPADVARVYNNEFSRSLQQSQAAPFWRAARMAANGLTMLKLGVSSFHLGTMANEGEISDVARAFQALSRGDLKTAARAAAAAPTSFITTPLRGAKFRRMLLDAGAQPSSIDKTVMDAFVRSGSRINMDPFYRTRGAGSFYDAFRRGTFRRELGDAFGRMYKGTPWENAKGTIDMAGNVIQSTAAPLFETYIPLMKQGAFAKRMEDWVRANPGATQAEIDRMAIKVSDSIDNRFGELVQDNLFWHRWMKEMAQITLLSATWDLGTVREIAGGLKDVVTGESVKGVIDGKGVTDRTAYVAALAATTALNNAIYQYLKTGQAPQSARDLMAARTGGTDAASGQPERAMMPGYQKDVFAYGYNFPYNVLQESENKLSPWLKMTGELLNNKDYRGLPITAPQGVVQQPGQPGLSDYLLEQLMPISIGQLSTPRKEGSNISTPERLLSIRPAPRYLTDPAGMEAMRNKHNAEDWKRRLRSDARIQAQQEKP